MRSMERGGKGGGVSMLLMRVFVVSALVIECLLVRTRRAIVMLRQRGYTHALTRAFCTFAGEMWMGFTGQLTCTRSEAESCSWGPFGTWSVCSRADWVMEDWNQRRGGAATCMRDDCY